jgi:hypothetical protein
MGFECCAIRAHTDEPDWLVLFCGLRVLRDPRPQVRASLARFVFQGN